MLLRVATDIDRQQEIGRAKLHAVAGKKHHHLVAALDVLAKDAQGLLHAALSQIRPQRHLEARSLQALGHDAGIGARIEQGGHGLVAVVADDQGQTSSREHGGLGR